LKHRSAHTTYPLRRIIRTEKQAGKSVVLMECGHAVLGRPASARYSLFFPCEVCHGLVEAFREAHRSSNAAAANDPTARRRTVG
jgi:hypothetical protein